MMLIIVRLMFKKQVQEIDRKIVNEVINLEKKIEKEF